MLRFTRWFGVIFFFRPLSLPWIKWQKIRNYLFQNPETQRPPDVWDQTRFQLSSQCQWQRHAGSPDLMRWWFGAQGIQCWEIQRWRIEIHFIYCQLEFLFFGGVTSHWSQGTGYLTSSREYFNEIPILSWWAMRKIIINVFLFHRVCWYWRNTFPILYLHTGIANMTFVTNCM